MARKALYDLTEVMTLAMELFNEKGFAGTSMDELINYTGFNRRSMYAEFGNKQQFFIAVIKRYTEQGLNPIVNVLKGDKGQIGIEAFFYKYNRHINKRGCLLVTASCELALIDPELNAQSIAYYQQLREDFEHCLAVAVERGELKSGLALDALSLQLQALVKGLSVMAKQGATKEQLDIAVEAVLKPIKRAD